MIAWPLASRVPGPRGCDPSVRALPSESPSDGELSVAESSDILSRISQSASLEEHLQSQHSHIVTVFGSSRVSEGHSEYVAAQDLGRQIAQRGWTLCNGGNEGTMEATARGAKAAGGKTIGVTLERYRAAPSNSWLDQEIVADTLLARLEHLTSLGEAYVVLRGGIGTLLELSLVWNLLQSAVPHPRPVIVVGKAWATVLTTIGEALPMHKWEPGSLTLVDSIDQAIQRLDIHFRLSANS